VQHPQACSRAVTANAVGKRGSLQASHTVLFTLPGKTSNTSAVPWSAGQHFVCAAHPPGPLPPHASATVNACSTSRSAHSGSTAHCMTDRLHAHPIPVLCNEASEHSSTQQELMRAAPRGTASIAAADATQRRGSSHASPMGDGDHERWRALLPRVDTVPAAPPLDSAGSPSSPWHAARNASHGLLAEGASLSVDSGKGAAALGSTPLPRRRSFWSKRPRSASVAPTRCSTLQQLQTPPAVHSGSHQTAGQAAAKPSSNGTPYHRASRRSSVEPPPVHAPVQQRLTRSEPHVGSALPPVGSSRRASGARGTVQVKAMSAVCSALSTAVVDAVNHVRAHTACTKYAAVLAEVHSGATALHTVTEAELQWCSASTPSAAPGGHHRAQSPYSAKHSLSDPLGSKAGLQQCQVRLLFHLAHAKSTLSAWATATAVSLQPPEHTSQVAQRALCALSSTAQLLVQHMQRVPGTRNMLGYKSSTKHPCAAVQKLATAVLSAADVWQRLHSLREERGRPRDHDGNVPSSGVGQQQIQQHTPRQQQATLMPGAGGSHDPRGAPLQQPHPDPGNALDTAAPASPQRGAPGDCMEAPHCVLREPPRSSAQTSQDAGAACPAPCAGDSSAWTHACATAEAYSDASCCAVHQHVQDCARLVGSGGGTNAANPPHSLCEAVQRCIAGTAEPPSVCAACTACSAHNNALQYTAVLGMLAVHGDGGSSAQDVHTAACKAVAASVALLQQLPTARDLTKNSVKCTTQACAQVLLHIALQAGGAGMPSHALNALEQAMRVNGAGSCTRSGLHAQQATKRTRSGSAIRRSPSHGRGAWSAGDAETKHTAPHTTRGGKGTHAPPARSKAPQRTEAPRPSSPGTQLYRDLHAHWALWLAPCTVALLQGAEGQPAAMKACALLCHMQPQHVFHLAAALAPVTAACRRITAQDSPAPRGGAAAEVEHTLQDWALVVVSAWVHAQTKWPSVRLTRSATWSSKACTHNV